MKCCLLSVFVCCLINSLIAQSHFTISGKSTKPYTGKVYLFVINPIKPDSTLADSTTITHQTFQFKNQIKEPTLVVLKAGGKPQAAFLWDNNIDIVLDTDKPDHTIVSNSIATQEWDDFRTSLDPDYEQEVVAFKQVKRERAKQPKRQTTMDTTDIMPFVRTGMHLQQIRRKQIHSFIQNHPLSWVNLYLLIWYRYELGRATTYRFMRQLPNHLTESALYRQLDLAIQEMN